MSKGLIGALVGVFIVLGGAAFFLINQQADKTKETNRAAAEKARLPKQPAIIDLSLQDAGKTARENLKIDKVSIAVNSSLPDSAVDYVSLAVKISGGRDFSRLFRLFYNQPISLIVVTGQVVSAGKAMLATPILILKQSGPPTSFELLYHADGQVLPYAKNTLGGPIDVAFNIQYLDKNLAESDIQSIVKSAKRFTNAPPIQSLGMALNFSKEQQRFEPLLKNIAQNIMTNFFSSLSGRTAIN